MSYCGSTTAASRDCREAMRYEEQPRSSWRNCLKYIVISADQFDVGGTCSPPTLDVGVHSPCGAGRSDGAAVPWRAASPTVTRKSNTCRPCWRQDATTVSGRSAKRLPTALSDPKLPLRHSTAGRKGGSATLLVGSTPS